jgi:hypothetical protein
VCRAVKAEVKRRLKRVVWGVIDVYIVRRRECSIVILKDTKLRRGMDRLNDSEGKIPATTTITYIIPSIIYTYYY